MKDRLIDLLHDSDLSLDSVRLADHLLSNGVIVLPCKVGNKVYWIGNKERVVKTYVINAISSHNFDNRTTFIIQAREPHKLDSSWDYEKFCDFHFGKSVFLTREEAEKALAESEDE